MLNDAIRIAKGASGGGLGGGPPPPHEFIIAKLFDITCMYVRTYVCRYVCEAV